MTCGFAWRQAPADAQQDAPGLAAPSLAPKRSHSRRCELHRDGERKALQATATVVARQIANRFSASSIRKTHIVEAEGPEDLAAEAQEDLAADLAAEAQEAREDLAVEAQEDLTREETVWKAMTSTAKEKETTLTGPSTS